MKKVKSWLSSSLLHSRKTAADLSKIFTLGDIVLLEGDLGSGKTFLVQHICRNWNITEEVTSPTFTIIQNYNGDKLVNHMDLYRIEHIPELDQLGWEDMIYSDAVSFIEWPQKIECLIDSFYKIKITLKNNKRQIELLKK
jgi:tRNA threonylcarbamoyl adenosine modification protein YjeE